MSRSSKNSERKSGCLARCDSKDDHRHFHTEIRHLDLGSRTFSFDQFRIMSLTNGSAEEAARAAKLSSRTLAILSTEDRNSALQSIHDALSAARSDILQANARDLEIATKSAADGELSQSILKRLDLSRPGKFEDMLKGILDVKGLEDPGMSFMNSGVCTEVVADLFLQLERSICVQSWTMALFCNASHVLSVFC